MDFFPIFQKYVAYPSLDLELTDISFFVIIEQWIGWRIGRILVDP